MLAVRVRTPSRLHFGLLAFGEQAPRQFGGVGVMVERPGNEVLIGWQDVATRDGQADSAVQCRAEEFARRFFESLEPAVRRALPKQIEVRVQRAAPEHVGLGTGTQLAMAVARGLSVWARMSDRSVEELACRLGRGTRSGIGVHGFERGGFLVEGGKRELRGIAPLVARLEFPSQWYFVLITPGEGRGLHGKAEREAFDGLSPMAPEVTSELCRLTMLGLLPAVADRDFTAFSEALHDFGCKVGECFAACQGGVYASPMAPRIAELLRHHGVYGVAQSSWGPTLCAVTESQTRAEWVAARLRDTLSADAVRVICTPASNRGAKAELIDG